MSGVLPISWFFFFLTYDHYFLNNSDVRCGTHIRVILFMTYVSIGQTEIRIMFVSADVYHVCIM